MYETGYDSGVSGFPDAQDAADAEFGGTSFAAEPAGEPISYSPLASTAFPEAVTYGAARSYRLIDGTICDEDEIINDRYGAQLVGLRRRTDRYGFLDGLFEGSWLSKIPFFGFFASVGSDLSAANDVVNAFQKLQRGEPLTRDEAIKATLRVEEQNMRANGTGWYTFGSIVGQAPSFMSEMGLLNLAGGAARTAAVRHIAENAASGAIDEAAESLAKFGTTKAVKTATIASAKEFITPAIKGAVESGEFATESAAAAALLDNDVFIKNTAQLLSQNTRTLMNRTAPYVVDYSTWTPGLLDKVSNNVSENAIRAYLASASKTSGTQRFFDSLGRAIGSSFNEGIMDLGAWGHPSATTMVTSFSTARQAFGQAALDFTTGALTRGAALFLPREAITHGLSELAELKTGNPLVRRSTLDILQAGWQNDDPDLMSAAETYGMFIDLLEYVSENTGRGFNSMMRGAGLAVAPKLVRPATRIAGPVTARGSALARNSAGEVTGLTVSTGLIDEANAGQAGGVVGRFVEKVFGGRSLKANVAEDQLTATRYALGKALGGRTVPDSIALRTTIATGQIDAGLPEELARIIGPNVRSYVSDAVSLANREIKTQMKIHGWLRIHAANFLAEHNFDAQRAWESFKSMGYDGVLSEMFEERYNDFVQELFGLDAKRADFHDRVTTAVKRLFVPEGGWKQLLAEAAAFSVPAVMRSGVARSIAAVSTENNYAKSAAWSSTVGDVLKHGASVGRFARGDYLARANAQIDNFVTQRKKQEEIVNTGMENGVPINDLRASDLRQSIEQTERAEGRARRMLDLFMASVGADVPDSEVIAAPVYSDADFMAEDFDMHVHLMAEDAQKALRQYGDLLAYAPMMGQTQYKERHQMPEESDDFFRRASHWIVEHAIRGVGFMATGDISFLSANAEQFAAMDRGVDRHLLDLLTNTYRNYFDATVQELRDQSADNTVDLEQAHALALERYSPHARAVVARYLAASQIRMFSDDEIADLALANAAEQDGYAVDAINRRLVSTDNLDTITYGDYLAKPGVQARVDQFKEVVAKSIFDTLLVAGSERADASVPAMDLKRRSAVSFLRDVMRIPKGLATADQATLATVLKYSPSFAGVEGGAYRSVMTEHKVDSELPLDDQLFGASAPAAALNTLADMVLDGKTIDQIEDLPTFVAEAAEKVESEALESLAYSLQYPCDFTAGGRRARNMSVIWYALQSQAVQNPDTVVFARPPLSTEHGGPLTSMQDKITFATRTADGWSGLFTDSEGNIRRVSASTIEELEREVTGEEFGYARRARRIIHTPVKLLYADSAQDFLLALPGMADEYRRQLDASQRTLQDARDREEYKDPEYRRDPNDPSKFQFSRKEAVQKRREEAALSALYVANGMNSTSSATHKYLALGESRTDRNAMQRAAKRQRDAHAAWQHREMRENGRPVGYNAVAVDLANSVGVLGGNGSSLDNLFGLVDPGLRNKFAMTIQAYSARHAGDIYIPIDHENAQSYSASLLTAALKTTMARNRPVLESVLDSQIKGFLAEVERLIYNPQNGKIVMAEREKDVPKANRWRAFGEWSVEGISRTPEYNEQRRTSGRTTVSLDVLDKFTQAFCLFRTDVPDVELRSALGQYADELREIAAEVRNTSAYLGFCAAMDLALGGTGFDVNPETARGRGRGLSYFFSLFSPATAEFRQHMADIQAMAPGVRSQLRFALNNPDKVRPPRGPAARNTPEVTPPEAEAPVEPAAPITTPLDIVHDVVAEVAGDTPLTEEQKTAVASVLGGNTPDVVEVENEETPEARPSAGEPSEEPEEPHRKKGTDDLKLEDEFFADAQPAPTTVGQVTVDSHGDRVLPVDAFDDVNALTDDEARAFGQALGRAISVVEGDLLFSGALVSREAADAFLRKIAPGMDDAERAMVVDAYMNSKGKDRADDAYPYLEDRDEDGVTPSEMEFNNMRNVNILKSASIRRMLAVISRVAPLTGRDFQPFLEDIRDFLQAAPDILADRIADRKTNPLLADAVKFTRELLSPRANDHEDANGRDAYHYNLVRWFAAPTSRSTDEAQQNWKRLQGYVRAFLKGDQPACARAGMFLAYLMAQPPNVLQSLVSFVANAAPAAPVELKKAAGFFSIVPANPKKSSPSPSAVDASFMRLAGQSPEEVKKATARLKAVFDEEFANATREGWVNRITSVPNALKDEYANPARARSHRGLMDVYARAMSKVFGTDSPVAAVFMSRLFDRSMARSRNGYKTLLAPFVFKSSGALPAAVQDIIDMLNEVADATPAGQTVSRQMLSDAAIDLFQTGGPQLRQPNFAMASTMDRAPWAKLLVAYSESKPVSVMRAKADEAIRPGAKPSLAITMPGIEPAIQQFLDRKVTAQPEEAEKPADSGDNPGANILDHDKRDKKLRPRGFIDMCKEWMPDETNHPDFDIGILRQRMEWPDGTPIVCKNTLTTAFANEIVAGARSDYKAPGAQMLRVLVYSGDHKSSILVQCPFAAELKKRKYSYTEAALMVSRSIGLDMLGIDAKRSAVTCLEAPSVSLWGVETNADGTERRGHVMYAVLWNSADGADNEAYKGALGLYGYGAKRLRMLARDAKLAPVKCHIAPTGPDKWGTMLGLTKALATAHFRGSEVMGTFLENTPMRLVADFSESLVGNDNLSSAVVTDSDSAKLTIINSKVFGVADGEKKVTPIMSYVFSALKSKISDGTYKTGMTIDEIAGSADVEHAGEVLFRNRSTGVDEWARLSDVIPGIAIREVPNSKGMFALVHEANSLSAFQVANVAHTADSEESELSRNYLMDIGNLAITVAPTEEELAQENPMYPGKRGVTASAVEYTASYGMIAAAIVRDPDALNARLEKDEEYQRLKMLGLPLDGDQANEIKRRVYAAWVKELRTPPVVTIPAALVSNGAWVNKADGTVHSHCEDNLMFMDTLRGVRSVGINDREFIGTNKRVALSNVNCADPSFRCGLYIDDEGLLSDQSLIAYGFVPSEFDLNNPEDRRYAVYLTIENAITAIATSRSDDAEHRKGEILLRQTLGRYLYDHRGITLFERIDRDGNSVADSVGFLDLFTRMQDKGGQLAFDRSAIYERMRDKDGTPRFYLGGTKFELPRTPSGNGQVQVVRAGLPVTEIVDEKDPRRWRVGIDAWVAPDPYTLKILGCDHDGDKSSLLLLDQEDTHVTSGSGQEFSMGYKEIVDLFAHTEECYDIDRLAAFRKRLFDLGIIRRGRDGDITFSFAARRRLANTMASYAFDLNLALPVFTDEDDAPLYAGLVADSTRRGDTYRGTKTAPAPDAPKNPGEVDVLRDSAVSSDGAWDVATAKDGVLAPETLNMDDKSKWLESVDTAAAAQTSGILVAETRARFVAATRDLHVLRLAGLSDAVGFGTLLSSASDFVDLLYHLDGPNNMAFDDMKEQKCSRMGLLPGMVDTFLAAYSGLINHRPAFTDAVAIANAVDFARKVNDPKHFYYWMRRASNPSDIEFVAEDADEAPLTPDEAKTITDAMPEGMDATNLLSRLDDASPFAPGRGIRYALRHKDKVPSVDMQELLNWYLGVLQLEAQRTRAASLNYTYADPGEAGNKVDLAAAVDDALGSGNIISARMGLASAFLNSGEGATPEDLGVNAVRSATRNFLTALGAVPANGYETLEGTFLAAYSKSKKLDRSEQLRAATNVRMLGKAAAAFAKPRTVENSIFNSDDASPASRFYQQCSLIAEATASERHPATKAKKGKRPAVNTNATLDFMWFVEASLDLLARLTASQPGEVQTQFPLSSYFREIPSATPSSSMFDYNVYGPAAENSARITLAMGGMSVAALRKASRLVYDIVEARKLDTDSELGKMPFQPRGRKLPVKGVTFGFSADSLEALANYFGMLRTPLNEVSVKEGKQRDLQKTAKTLSNVMKRLSKSHPDLFPPGFVIEPSALLGQLLPAYASITDFVDGVPGPESKTLPVLFLSDLAVQEKMVRDARKDPRLKVYLALAESLDYSARTQNTKKFGNGPAVPRARSATAGEALLASSAIDNTLVAYNEEGAIQVGDTFKAVKDAIKQSKADLYWDEDQPAGGNNRHLGIFDGTRGVVFEALVAMLRGAPAYEAVEESALTPAFQPDVLDENEARRRALATAGVRPGSRAARVLGLESPVEEPEAKPAPRPATPQPPSTPDRVQPEIVQEIAKHVGQMFKLWSNAHVKNGKDDQSFYITADMKVDGVKRPVRINVRVVPGSRVEAEASDDAYIRTLALRSGKSADAIRKDPALLASLKTQFPMAGLTRRSNQVFQMSSQDVGVLVADVTLAANPALFNGTSFHEAGHAVLGFAYSAGVLTDADIKVLAAPENYGSATVGGRAWFNEEKFVDDLQKLMLKGESEARSQASGAVDKILEKLFSFIKMLAEALKGIITKHTSADYANPIRSNPLTGFVLTGEINSSSLADKAKSMDADTIVWDAVKSMFMVLGVAPTEAAISQYISRSKAVDPENLARVVKVYGRVIQGKVLEDANGNVAVAEPDAVVTTPNPNSIEAILPEDAIPSDQEAQPGSSVAPATEQDAAAEKAASDDFDVMLDVQPYIPRVREALDAAGIPRMAAPYSESDALAAAVGTLIRREGDSPEASKLISKLLPPKKKDEDPGYNDERIAVMKDTVRRIAHLYGVKQTDDEGLEKLTFRALNAVAEALDQERTSGDHGANMARMRSHTSAAVLAAKVAVTSGVLPGDILEAAITDIVDLLSRKGTNPKLVAAVNDRILSVLKSLYAESADPTGLLGHFAPGSEEGETSSDPHAIFAALSAGIHAEGDSDRGKTFVISNVDEDGRVQETGNPAAPDNVAAFKSFEGDALFDQIMRTALDAVYMVAASQSMYRDLGFTPCASADNVVDERAMSVLDMLVAEGATPDMYTDPDFHIVGGLDEGWFSAASPEMWLDSMMRPSFGAVDLRTMPQELNRQLSQFQYRVTNIRNIHDHEYGLSGNPGDALFALDEEYAPQFAWREGGIEHRADRRLAPDGTPVDDPRYKNARRYLYLDRVHAKYKDGDHKGEKIIVDLDDVRWNDLIGKARYAHMTGSEMMLTGVNGLTFSLEDNSNPGYYDREKVLERKSLGRADPHKGQSYFDQALERLDIQLADSYGKKWFDDIVGYGPGKYNLRNRLVDTVCAALREAKRRHSLGYGHEDYMSERDVNDFVIGRLVDAKLAVGVQKVFPGTKTPRYTSAAVALHCDTLERLYEQTAAYKKLIAAGRKPEWLTREAFEKPYLELIHELRAFVNNNPYFTDGDGRFFLGITSPLPFVRGQGVTLWGLHRAPAQSTRAEKLSAVQAKFSADMSEYLGDNSMDSNAGVAPIQLLRMLRAVYRLPNDDDETMRYKVTKGMYSGMNGCPLTDKSTGRDLVNAIASRLRDLAWGEATDGLGLEEFGGAEAVRTALERFWGQDDPSATVNSSGLSQEAIYRITGTLPANYQAGHAVQNMIDGLMNALGYRATLINMITTPDLDGMPVCFAKPALNADEVTGVPDAVWGAVARWWGELYGITYNGMKTGVENARDMYDTIVNDPHDRFIKRGDFGTISQDRMDSRTVEAFVARKGVPEGESEMNRVVGGYALGYAKHLFMSTRGLGGKWQRALWHRALAYSKSMSVSFSLFFPLATKYESPIGAVGVAATLGGTLNAKWMREHADAMKKIFGALGNGWITSDFIGEQDYAKMLDTNDPFLADMYRYVSAVGLTMSTNVINPYEHSRGILKQDLDDTVEFVRRKWGDEVAKRVSDISNTLLTRSSERAFTYHLNAVKMAVASQMCMKLRADAQARGVAFDPVRDLRRYASYINAEIGGIDPLQYAWAHPGMRNILESMFFSFNWTRGAWEAGGGKIIEQMLFGGHDVTAEERRYMVGRAMRMWGWVAFGLPTLAQFLIKAIGMGIDPDHEDREDEKWWIWQNEDKAFMKSFDLTPIMRAIAKRFPMYAELRDKVPMVAGLPMLGYTATHNPWFLGAAALLGAPVYTGNDPRNVTHGRHYYMHFAKQAWEFERWFDEPLQQFLSKLSMPIQRIFEGLTGRSLTLADNKLAWHAQGDLERWLFPTGSSALVNLLKALVPFSVSGLTEYGDAGILSVLGPVSMGTAGGTATAGMERELDAWISNDRRGYAFGGRERADYEESNNARAMSDNAVVRRYVAQLRANKYSDDQILQMVQRVIRDLAAPRIQKLVELMPDDPNGSYDTKEWGRLIRELRRLGLTLDSIYRKINDRLVRAGRSPSDESSERATQLTQEVVERPYTY